MVVFWVLGNVEAAVDGRRIDVGHARQQCVLAALLMDVDKTVPVEALIRRVWGEQAPQRVNGTLQSYLTRLRRALGDEASIVRRTGGYTLVIADPLSVDVHQFAHLITQARATEDRRQAVELFTRALRLWRGDALAGLDSQWVASVREQLAGQRLAAELDHTDLRLALGQHSDLIPELSSRSREHPMDERAAGQLMVALYWSGRQAEALACYRSVRTVLADELGADPGAALQELHQRILTADQTLAVPVSTSRAHQPPTVPRQLPAPPAGFSGRSAELAVITETLASTGDTVPVVTITGSGGIGKTALTLRWAHQHVEQFPDGQLHVNLRGFDPGSAPMSSSTAVRGFLEALQVSESAVPADLDGQSALYRSLLAQRRMLIVLDNAADSAQVEPLLPGGPGCAVLVTSRDRLSGLITKHGARPLPMDVLSENAARALLAARIGVHRLNLAPAAVAELLDCCGGFPLALSIVAGRAQTRPGLPLIALSEELRDATTRLGVLDEDDPGSGVTAVLSCSYNALSPAQARLFALFGLMPGPDISQAAAASLVAVRPAEAGPILRALERLSLVQQDLPGRWRTHDVVRLYAANRAQADLTEQERQAALRRLVSFYLHSAYNADDAMGGYPQGVELEPLAPGCYPERQTDTAAAISWFSTERRCLLAAQQLAAAQGWYEATWQLGWSMENFHYRRALYQDYFTTCQTGLAAAAHLDTRSQIRAYRSLGRAYSRLRRFPETLYNLDRALELAVQDRNVYEQALTHQVLGLVHGGRLKDHVSALAHFANALRLFEEGGHELRQAESHNEIALCLAWLNRFDEARPHSEQALMLLRGHEEEGDVMDNMGLIAYQSGDYEQAVVCYRRCIDLYLEHANTNSAAAALERLGSAHRALGQHDQAREALWRALELFQVQQRDPDVERVLVQINEISAAV